jgi:dihydrofolate reductase
MKHSKIGLIWAQTTAGVIGAAGAIPWRIPEDLAHFRDTTAGHPIIMGRRTWDSLPERLRPLKDRRNIVVTTQRGWQARGAEVEHDLLDALQLASPFETWVIGGGQIYSAAIDLASELRVTEIDADIDGDAYAPAIGTQWQLTGDGAWHESTGGIRFRFRTYTR